MYCIHCGIENPNNVYYCKGCGRPFLRKQLEEIGDEYKINVCISIVVGICTGIISGIFSAAFSSLWHPELWVAALVFLAVIVAVVMLIIYATKTLATSLKNRIKRNL